MCWQFSTMIVIMLSSLLPQTLLKKTSQLSPVGVSGQPGLALTKGWKSQQLPPSLLEVVGRGL
jgi:hypothetical protein